MTKRSDDFSGRLRIICIFLFIVAGILLYRLFDMQVLSFEKYRGQADRQYGVSDSGASLAGRGNLYFREKNGQLVTAAVTKEGYSLIINPSAIKEPEKIYSQISPIVQLDRDDFLRRSQKPNDTYELISHYLNQDQADRIKKLAIKGVDAAKEDWRFYPAGRLASQVLGFVGYSGDDRLGQYGVEKYYENYLKGTNETAGRNSLAGAFLGLSRGMFSALEIKNDLVLTIEPSVQGFLEAVLEQTKQKYSAESAAGVILEPKTGKILAMASKPDFEPNNYGQAESLALYRNPIVSSIFELGSVMKPITLASAIDSGKITPDTAYYDAGYLVLDKARIENYDGKGRGTVSMQEVLNQSLNTGAVFAMEQMGKENFKNYLLNFGLGEKTGITLPDEAKGDVKSLAGPREVEYATASFGQGIAVTPLEFAAAFGALANGGYLMQPYIIEGQNQPAAKRQVIKKETGEDITRMLVKVVDTALVGGAAKVEHYSIAAKTGTAQLPFPDKKGYSDDYLHVFTGYAPAFDPRFLVLLYLEKPQGAKYASNTLTAPFMDTTKFLLNYYEVPPDR